MKLDSQTEYTHWDQMKETELVTETGNFPWEMINMDGDPLVAVKNVLNSRTTKSWAVEQMDSAVLTDSFFI